MNNKKHKHYKKNYKPLIFSIIAIVLIAGLIIVANCIDFKSDVNIIQKNVEITNPGEKPTKTNAPKPSESPTPEPVSRRGTSEVIPESVRASMQGKSMKTNANISFDDLRYLTIPHYDFEYNVTTGHLVVHASLAEEVLDIFAELFDAKYPIQRMELIDKYDADDFTSIEYNNTSAFNYRQVSTGTGKLSNHAFGRAIDINPQQNPYVYSNGTGAHENAREYWKRDVSKWSREIDRAAYIGNDTEIYRIFKKYGWTWGGDWSSAKDYQHFEK